LSDSETQLFEVLSGVLLGFMLQPKLQTLNCGLIDMQNALCLLFLAFSLSMS